MATLQRESDVAATREAVVAGLSAYNAARVGPRNSEPLALSLRDGDGVIVGGLIGELKWEWLHIDLLWIDVGAFDEVLGRDRAGGDGVHADSRCELDGERGSQAVHRGLRSGIGSVLPLRSFGGER